MKFSIRGLLLLTLIAAVGARSWVRYQRIEAVKLLISEQRARLRQQNFDAEYVDAHTLACQQAIKANPLPSPYYLAAKNPVRPDQPAKRLQRFHELSERTADAR